MKKEMPFKFFRASQGAGIAYELVCFGGMLLCGTLLSELLSAVMAGQWQRMYKIGLFAVLALAGTVLPRYFLSVWRRKQRRMDAHRFRTFLYQCVLDRTIRAENHGEMEVRLQHDAETIAQFCQETCPKAISGAAILICSTILICRVNWKIGLIFFSMNLTQLIPVLVYEKWARQIYNQTHADEEAYCNWMLEGYKGIRTIKAYGVEGWYMKRFYQLNQAIVDSGKRAEQTGTVENIIFYAIDSLLNYGSYVIIGLFVLFGGLAMEDTPLLIILAGYLFSSISSVYDLRLQQFKTQEACKQLGFREVPGVQTDGEYALKAERVSKAFDEKQVLENVSCTVRMGERVLLKGENGSGKSTLLRILTGLEKADSGAVACGVPKNAIAVSLQEEPTLNITGAALAQAIEASGCASKAAMERHFQGFRIRELLDKRLSEMSPGERKKFYLAVALAHRSEVLILDEPTNHLDQNSVHYLCEQLRAYSGTLVVCTHASDLGLNWSKTIFMEGGMCHAS